MGKIKRVVTKIAIIVISSLAFYLFYQLVNYQREIETQSIDRFEDGVFDKI